ncbi:MAG: hypothetical protein ACTHLU_09175 [Novosphingobium sp.]
MTSRLPLILVAPALMMATAAGSDRSDIPPARITGEPVSCIRLTQFSDSRVRDDHTIDFLRNSRQGWRNTLPQRCAGLRSANAFTYKVSTGELCSVDIITVLDNVGGGLQRGGSCGLGQFVPIELERR